MWRGPHAFALVWLGLARLGSARLGSVSFRMGLVASHRLDCLGAGVLCLQVVVLCVWLCLRLCSCVSVCVCVGGGGGCLWVVYGLANLVGV